MRHFSALSELLALRAKKGGERIFIAEPDTGRTLRFGELRSRAETLARLLRRNGFRRGERAGLIFMNGIEAVLAFFAVIEAEGAAVPLPPGHSARELALLLEDAELSCLLSTEALAPELEAKTGLAGPLSLPGNLLLYPLSPPKAGASPQGWQEDTALLLYTSGSTGKPKGVPLTHSNLLAECRNIRAAHRLRREDTALCLLPLYHINGLVVTLLTPLLAGLKVVMPPRFSASRFWTWVREHRVSWFSAVPAIYAILLGRRTPAPEEISCLRFARSASAPLPVKLLREFEKRTGVPLIESYGISEGGSQITSNPLPPAARKAGSVGLPFGNEVRIFLADGETAPAGVSGEVAVRGDNLAAAYFKNPGATAESFRDGWFRTGDLGFLDSEGYLLLRGRGKELINRAGEKIAPAEIDEVLYRHPGVELAAAVGVPHALYGEEVVAFLRLRPGATAGEEDILSFCADKLAGFKIPKRIFFREGLPQGPSGKIQRLKLVDEYLALPESDRVLKA
ncbi:MAG: AMP-binding protein [Deltaproteobacteria bacterium]|jgi:acyl-CoA synthetase (AMP-forming)/AMP-acid ligase II|nr:AMP-binding protein [Deltaproteobacteria bacterium]